MAKRSGLYSVPFEVPELSIDEAVALAADTGKIARYSTPLLETVVEMSMSLVVLTSFMIASR